MIKSSSEFSGLNGVILPGVGNFGDCCRALKSSGMWEEAGNWARSGHPFFGVCVGYQMLFESSEEAPGVPGLSVFLGKVHRFPAGPLKVPQIGWNQVRKVGRSPMLKEINDGDFVYFVHSYYVQPEDPQLTSLETEYGVTFVSAIEQGNLFATQFHPEKSQRVGLQLWKNFVSLVAK